MRKWFLLPLIGALALLACRLESQVIEDFLQGGGAEATYDAMFTPPATATPKGQVDFDFLHGGRTVTPAPATEVPTPGPTPTSYIVLRSVEIKPTSGDWAPYFETADDIADYHPGSSFSRLGVLRSGLSVSVIEEIQGGRILKVLISGSMELNDLDVDFTDVDPQNVYRISGQTRCVEHTWKHTDGADCHAHFLNAAEPVATIAEGMSFIIISQSIEQLTVSGSSLQERVQVLILDPVWIRCQDAATGCPSGNS